MYKAIFKRLLDFIMAVCGFILLSPVFIIVMIFLAIANDGKPFFFQTRPGRGTKLFKIIKFKTMNDRKDVKGELLPDRDRLTRVGSFVRKTSLDEIPQLLNVILGEMSIIGPRPLLSRYLPFYTPTEMRRHEVRPGITGWAQVNGRNTVRWDERLELDVYYVDKLNFKLDVLILYRTFLKVISSKDIIIDPESVMQNLDDERRI